MDGLYPSIKKGTALPLMEEFYTLQGEGYHTGKAAYFIRIGGCDIACSWCDTKLSWNANKYPPVPADEVVERVISSKANSVVVTGGEPLMYNLGYFTTKLKGLGIQTFLETSGAYPFSGTWDWVCVSPKKNTPPLQVVIQRADELKVIIQTSGDFKWAELNAGFVKSTCHLFLQPEWSVSAKITPEIVEYIKLNQQWRISLQSHKFMKIP